MKKKKTITRKDVREFENRVRRGEAPAFMRLLREQWPRHFRRIMSKRAKP